MRRRTKRLIGAVVVVGAIAAGGAAYTAASSIPNTVVGYASATISGANATNMKYDLNARRKRSNGDLGVHRGSNRGHGQAAVQPLDNLSACAVQTDTIR